MNDLMEHVVEYGYRSSGDGHEVWANSEQALARLMLGGVLWCGDLVFRTEDRAQLEAAADAGAPEPILTGKHALPKILHCAHSIYMKVVRETFRTTSVTKPVIRGEEPVGAARHR